MRDSTFEAAIIPYAQDPADFFRYLGAYGSEQWMSEKSLWLAVLEDAYHCVQPRRRVMGRGLKHGSRRAREAVDERADAEAWVVSEADYVGSFHFVCDVLDLDVDWTRHLMISPRGVVFSGEEVNA